ncbi:MAG: DUF333 domain-containing protein [Alcaligenaceae bacterium]|nr:DUF333 domain-containing protein [Alcaligenaceae bacterium]
MKLKLLIASTLNLLILSACTGAEPATTKPLNMANPASMHCQEKGGKTIIKNGEHGQYGICRLPDGTEIEEWEFYRQHHQMVKTD